MYLLTYAFFPLFFLVVLHFVLFIDSFCSFFQLPAILSLPLSFSKYFIVSLIISLLSFSVFDRISFVIFLLSLFMVLLCNFSDEYYILCSSGHVPVSIFNPSGAVVIGSLNILFKILICSFSISFILS